MPGGQQMSIRPLLAGTSRLVQILQPLDGSSISLFGSHQQQHARLRAILRNALALYVEFGEFHRRLAIAGLHGGPELRRGPGVLSLARIVARMRLTRR